MTNCPRCDFPLDCTQTGPEGGVCHACGREIEPGIDYKAEALNYQFRIGLWRHRSYVMWLGKEIFGGMPVTLLPGVVGICDGLTWTHYQYPTVDVGREIYGTT